MPRATPENTLGIYAKAVKFQETFGIHLLEPGGVAYNDMRTWLRYQNAHNPLAGAGLEVQSDYHFLAHTPAGALGKNIRITNCEPASGTLRGVLIGYNVMPFDNPWTGVLGVVLATVLDVYVSAQSDEPHRALAQTPITGADIEFIP